MRVGQLQRGGVALAVIVVGTLTGPTVASVAAAEPAVTVVKLDSPADPNSLGANHAYTFTGSQITSASGSAGRATLFLDGDSTFQIELMAPTGEAFVVGPYEGATSNGGATPELAFTWSGSSCSGPTGRFDILELPEWAPDTTLTRFAADFALDCGDRDFTGAIRIASSVPVKALDVDGLSGDSATFPQGTAGVAGTPLDLTLTNVGNVPVALSGVSFGGDRPDDFFVGATDCGTTIAVGAACTLPVVFAPLASSSVALMTIGSDAWAAGRIAILSGSAAFDLATNQSAATAFVIPSVPFRHAGQLTGGSGFGSWNSCPGDYGALYYRYSSTTKRRLSLTPGGGRVALSVAVGTTDVQPFACLVTPEFGPLGTLEFTAEANVTYLIRMQSKYPSDAYARLSLLVKPGAADTVVDASGMGVSATSVYPYKDGYKDTVGIKGTRLEKASVAISIYGPTGSRVRTLSAAAALGAYNVAWNGRTASGGGLPAGKYRIVQTVTDVWGNKRSATSYVMLSLKRLYLYTYSKTIDAGKYNAYGKAGTGVVSRSATTYSGGVRISTGSTGSAAVGYAVTVPSATVYKSIKFEVLGRGNLVAGTGGETGVQDWTRCSSWDADCVDKWGNTPSSYSWQGVFVPGTRHVSGSRVVRGYVQVWTFGGNISRWLDLRDVRFTVVYGILK